MGIKVNNSALRSDVNLTSWKKIYRIVELPGMSFQLGGGQTRVRLQTGGREQLLLRVLRRALKADAWGETLF